MTLLQAEKCTSTEITSQSKMAKRVENAFGTVCEWKVLPLKITQTNNSLSSTIALRSDSHALVLYVASKIQTSPHLTSASVKDRLRYGSDKLSA